MRYSILGFKQKELIKYDIDMVDVLLMDYIQRALSQPSMIKTTVDDQPYVWLHHSKILEDLPIINIKESMLKKRIAKLVEAELIKSITVANSSGRGSRAYYTITNQFESLQYDDMTECNNLPVVERPSVKNYTSDNTLNNNKNKTISKDIVGTTEFEFGKKREVVTKQKKPSLYDKCLLIINEFTDDTILQELLIASLKLFLENSRESGTPFYTNTFKGKLNNLKKLSEDNYVQRDIIKQTLDNGWNNFYELKSKSRKSGNARDRIEQLPEVEETTKAEKEHFRRSIKNGQKF